MFQVVYVTAILPYILLTTFLIRGLMLEGSVDGILYYLSPDFSRLTDFQVIATQELCLYANLIQSEFCSQYH